MPEDVQLSTQKIHEALTYAAKFNEEVEAWETDARCPEKRNAKVGVRRTLNLLDLTSSCIHK